MDALASKLSTGHVKGGPHLLHSINEGIRKMSSELRGRVQEVATNQIINYLHSLDLAVKVFIYFTALAPF